MARPLTEAQQLLAQGGTKGMRKSGISREQQIAAQQRSFIYDGALAPTCIRCGCVRQERRGLKCNDCERYA
jgi:hypothetical protein